jgi:hypothetical protein
MGRVFLLTGLAVGVILAIASILPHAPDEIEEKVPVNTVDRAPQRAPDATAESSRKPDAAGNRPKAEQPLILTAIGLKETTLKIIVDGERPKVYHLKPDTRLEIEAQREFNILVDDARAVTLYLNGEPVIVPGREGQQVTLQLP